MYFDETTFSGDKYKKKSVYLDRSIWIKDYSTYSDNSEFSGLVFVSLAPDEVVCDISIHFCIRH